MSLAKNLIQSEVNSTVNKVITLEQSLFYIRHNHCSLCSKELTIQIQKDSESLIVKEKVSCLNCNVTVSTSDHKMS